MHIVIGGEGEVGFRLAEQLAHEHEVVLVLPEELRVVAGAMSEGLDAASIRGSQTSATVLRKAGIERADVFIAASLNNESNLVACVAAKRFGARRTLCFLTRRDFQSQPSDDEALVESLGIDLLVRPAQQLAEELVRIVSTPGALDVQVFAGGRVRLLRAAIEPGARLAGASLKDVGIPRGVVLVMGRRGESAFIPGGLTTFEPDDVVTAMGEPQGLNLLLFGFLRHPRHGRDPRTATIVGGGMVGLAVAQGLERLGWQVKIIESSRRRCEQIAPLIRGLVLHGDGGDRTLLEQEQVGQDAVLIAVTSNDEKNLLVSLLAKEMGVSRIVTRADVLDNERLFERVGIDVVRSAQGAAIRSVIRGLVEGKDELLAELEHGDAEVLSLELPATIAPIAMSAMRLPAFAIVGAILRGRDAIIPRGDTQLQAGDHILVFCATGDEQRVRQYFLEQLPSGGA